MKKSLLFLGIASAGFAQVCMPETQPQPDNPYAYIRAEIKALKWIRYALAESQKIQPPAVVGDPDRFHNIVTMFTVAQTVSDDYGCAVVLLKNYKASKNESVAFSAETLLEGIDAIRDVNAKLMGTMEALYKAEKPQDLDQIGIAKMLAYAQGIQKDVRNLTMAGVKMSTFGIFRMQGEGDDAKPIAFAITEKQRATLLVEVQELTKRKDAYAYVDGCADILLGAVTRNLPVSVQ